MASLRRTNVVRFLDDAALRRRYVDAVLKLRLDGIYQVFVDWHADPLVGNSIAHGNGAFLAWHRIFIRLFEIQLQRADEALERARNPGASAIVTISLPYWDYPALNSATPGTARGRMWADDFLGGTGPAGVGTGPFRAAGANWQLRERTPRDVDMTPFSYNNTGGLRRDLGVAGLNLPSTDDIDHVTTQIPNFDTGNFDIDGTQTSSFRNVLEGFSPTNAAKKRSESQMHNGTHVWVGGNMGSVPIAPNDPVFWLHHCNIDRIWAKWQIRNVRAAQYPSDAQVTAARAAGNAGLAKSSDPLRPWTTDNKSWVAEDGTTDLFTTTVYTVRACLNWAEMGADLGGYEYDDVNSRNFNP